MFDIFQAQLQNLHDNLQQDYDNMAKEKEAQKDVEKQLRTEVKKLKTMSLSLDEDQEKLFRAKEAIGKAMFFIYLKYFISQTYEVHTYWLEMVRKIRKSG